MIVYQEMESILKELAPHRLKDLKNGRSDSISKINYRIPRKPKTTAIQLKLEMDFSLWLDSFTTFIRRFPYYKGKMTLQELKRAAYKAEQIYHSKKAMENSKAMVVNIPKLKSESPTMPMKLCTKCEQQGHWKSECKAKKEIGHTRVVRHYESSLESTVSTSSRTSTSSDDSRLRRVNYATSRKGATYQATEKGKRISFIIDSGATEHLTNNLKILTNIKRLSQMKRISCANNDESADLLIDLSGDLIILDESGNEFTIRNILYVDNVGKNLLSVYKIVQNDCKVEFTKRGVKVINELNENIIFKGYISENLWWLNFDIAKCSNFALAVSNLEMGGNKGSNVDSVTSTETNSFQEHNYNKTNT